MSYTQYKSIYDRYKQSLKGLHFGAGVTDNTATTKHIAVKPNRHSLAIFMPKIYGATNPIVTTGINTQRHFFIRAFHANTSQRNVTSYGGLREPNKIAFMVNKFRRLYAVVETCLAPFVQSKIQTKHIGVSNG